MALAQTSVVRHFGGLNDPRRERGRLHNLCDMIAIALCAVICGAESWEDVAEYGRQKESWLKTFLRLPNGIPSHDTFNRVFRLLKPKPFQACFARWMQGLVEATEGRIVAIDGKTLRHSFDRAADKSALHMISAWAVANGVSLGQQAVDGKSNEITAVPELLKLLELEGAIVTYDAMGCQKEIAQAIRDPGADYVWRSRKTSRGCTRTCWPRWRTPLKAIAAKPIDSSRRTTKGMDARSGANTWWSGTCRRFAIATCGPTCVRWQWSTPSGRSTARRRRNRATTSAVARARCGKSPERFAGIGESKTACIGRWT